MKLKVKQLTRLLFVVVILSFTGCSIEEINGSRESGTGGGTDPDGLMATGASNDPWGKTIGVQPETGNLEKINGQTLNPDGVTIDVGSNIDPDGDPLSRYQIQDPDGDPIERHMTQDPDGEESNDEDDDSSENNDSD